MWLSSAHLLKERYPNHPELNVGDEETLLPRLHHYLRQKLDYGFVEFFSTVYLPFTLGGLMNLAEFSLDDTIRSTARTLVRQLIQYILSATNSKGVFAHAAGRNYVACYVEDDKFETDGASTNDGCAFHLHDLIWLWTGLGRPPTRLRPVAAIFATSNLNAMDLMTEAPLQQSLPGSTTSIIPIRPSLPESIQLNQGPLTKMDRILFQWSYGAYFHHQSIDDTQWLMDELDLWDHGEFGAIGSSTFFDALPTWVLNIGSGWIEPLTVSSLLTGQDVVLFKNDAVMLSSVQQYHPGKLGYQSYPWMATTGTLSIWTQSGSLVEDWRDRPQMPSNTHLPYIEQVDNVLLVMYNAKDVLDMVDSVLPSDILGLEEQDVALHWSSQLQDGALYDDRWKCGYEEDNGGYICIARDCSIQSSISGIEFCSEEYQTWAIIVGNQAMYGDYSSFVATVQQTSTFKTEWRKQAWWCIGCSREYYGEIQFGDIIIGHVLHND